MKASVTQENLVKALNQVLKATSVKPNIPILANIHIKTERGKLRLSGTDLEISISVWIGGDIAEEGEITVNARLLTEFVGQLKGSRVELIQSGQTLEVKSTDNQAQLVIIPAEDFPTLPTAEKEPDIVVNAVAFKLGIQKTSFAAATDQTRPILTGILMETTKRKLSLVGVDGFRLSKKVIQLQSELDKDFTKVIPAKSLNDLAKLIADSAAEDDNLKITFMDEKNQVVFQVNEVTMTSRILDGKFPDYKQIIPTEEIIEAELERSSFEDSIKIASIFARNVIGYKTFLKIISDDSKVRLSAKVADMGNNESYAPINKLDGDDFETAYNAKFLLDMINSMEGEKITYKCNGITAPGIFSDNVDSGYFHVIMPMRIE